jgi:rhodanese-related sulfurtransferase/polyisoprenoid-binding protein YceI
MRDTNDYERISPHALKQKVENGKDLIIIDTLTKDHYAKVHLPNARNACVFEVTFLDQIAGIIPEKDDVVVVYGSSEKSMDATTAAEKLIRAGYSNVLALDGGLALWREAGYPLEGEQIRILEAPEMELRIEDGTYKVNTDQSIIEWTGRNPNTKHYGTIQLSGGEIIVNGGDIIGSFEIDMTSIKNINLEGNDLQPILISHLKSDDFFFVKMFPRALFSLKTARLMEKPDLSSPNFKVKGTLKLRGIKKEITFPATVNPLPEGGAVVEAHFDIDRTRWGVIYGSNRFFEHLGMHLVFDLISFQLRLVVEAKGQSL